MRTRHAQICRYASSVGRPWQAVSVLNLEVFLALVADSSAEWAEVGARWTTHRSPDDGRDKHSAWVTIRHDDREGQLTVWDSGEAELETGGPTGPMTQTHFDGLDTAITPLAELVALVIRR